MHGGGPGCGSTEVDLFDRRVSATVLDSADDMTSGGTSNVSNSEAGEPHNAEQGQNQHLGLVERQDSANYQPRPPALAERQDSAQVLQVALPTPSSFSVQAGPARMQLFLSSVRDLDQLCYAFQFSNLPLGADTWYSEAWLTMF